MYAIPSLYALIKYFSINSGFLLLLRYSCNFLTILINAGLNFRNIKNGSKRWLIYSKKIS